jgi:mandelamide amidase
VFFENLEPQVESAIQAQLLNLEKLGVKLKEINMSNIWSHNEAFGFPVVLYEVLRDLPNYLKKYASEINIDELVAGISSPDVAGVFASQMGPEAMPKSAYEAALNIHGPAMKSIYEDTFSENSLDAIIFPTTPLTARNIGEDETIDLNGVQVPTFPTYIRNTDLGSNVGAPGISLPCGGIAALPVGIELDGLPGRDEDLLGLAKSIEIALTS